VASGAVSLTWNAVSGATGYDVYRATASGGPFARLTASSQAATSYQDSAVVAGATYWYQVTASNGAGTSAASAAVSAAVPGAAQTVTVAIAPASATVDGCRTAQFAATVTGSADTSVTWSVQEGAAGGTITAAGLYTAPAAAGTYHVVATSNASGTATKVASVTVQDHILSVAVSPGSVSVAANGAQQFTATVTTTCGSFAATAQ
jgi:chitinase